MGLLDLCVLLSKILKRPDTATISALARVVLVDKNVFCGIEYDDRHSEMQPSEYEAMLSSVLSVIKPQPSPYPLIRIGDGEDGSYLVPDAFEGIKACFSPGVSNFKNFEDHLTNIYKMKCHMCDFTSNEGEFATPIINGMQTFEKLWLEPLTSADSISLRDWVKKYDDSGEDLLLQIDIEGAEYRNLIAAHDETLRRFRVIVIELHGLDRITDKAILATVFKPFFDKIGRFFTCVHAHPNNCNGDFLISKYDVRIPVILELTFLRKDHFDLQHGRSNLLIPHPLDVSRNVKKLPPLFLDEKWLDKPRPIEARHKMLSDTVDFISDRLAGEFSDRLDGIEQALRLIVAGKVDETPTVYDKYEEVALGKPYYLSSALEGLSKEGVVASDSASFFFHTDYGFSQSITIDLLSDKFIHRIEIENRRDMCFDRAKLLFAYFITEDNDLMQNNIVPISINEDFLSGMKTMAQANIPGIKARRVTILSPLLNYLHLSAIRIFAAKNGAIEPQNTSAPNAGDGERPGAR